MLNSRPKEKSRKPAKKKGTIPFDKSKSLVRNRHSLSKNEYRLDRVNSRKKLKSREKNKVGTYTKFFKAMITPSNITRKKQ